MNTQFFTKPAESTVRRLLSNKHTTIAGIILLAAYNTPWILIKITEIWSPEHVQQMKDTITVLTQWVEHLAIIYGLIMAGDSTPTAPKQ